MMKLRVSAAAAVGTAAMLGATAVPAQAAYPVTDFPQITNSQGAVDVTVTWYNRSVGISGAVSDNVDDTITTQACVYAFYV